MEQILSLITEMAPYLLLGFLIAGLMHAFIPSTIYSRYMSQPTFRSVLLAAMFGVPIPLCSCGVIPTAMSLRREGASKGAVASFLIATPQTGVDSIIATFSLMGLPFAIVRPIAALATALFGGQMVNLAEGKDGAGVVRGTGAVEAKCDCGCCGEDDCECEVHEGIVSKIRTALRYAFLEMMEDIGKWLVIGLVVAGLITVLVPDSFFAIFKDNTFASIVLVLCIAIPMYLCATGSIPIAVALMLKGLTPGAALVLLMAGPACNMASILVINKVLGRKTLVTYLASIIAGAVGFALIIDQMLPREWFISSLVAKDACCVEHQSWFSIVCTVLLFVLLANALIRHFVAAHSHGHAHNHAHCHSHEHDHGHEHCHCHEEHDHCECNEHHDCNDDHCHCHDHYHDASSLTFTINGMNCNHCRATAEKAILSVEGVTSASVDLPTKTSVVEGTASFEDISKAVAEVGFECVKE